MTVFWGGWDVRVDAAEAWMHLAPRFATEHPVIVDRVEAILDDPVAAVRLQAAQNLAIIGDVAPERMWEMAERIAARETSADVLASFLLSMRHFSHSAPERCEAILAITMGRLAGGFADGNSGTNELHETLGNWTAQLFAGQGRLLARDWLEEWAANPKRFGNLLSAFVGTLRAELFGRYEPDPTAETSAMCDRAQQGFELILLSATRISAEAYTVLIGDTASETERQQAAERYRAAAIVIHHALNQFYFGSGAVEGNHLDAPGLRDASAMMRFLADYAGILSMLADSRNPETLHHLIQLYEFLIPGDPARVFGSLHAILVGRGEQEGYHYETLATGVVVGIVQRYIADYRAIFEDEDRRASLMAILGLFADAGWPEALQLLYDLPDLLR